jgi:hypothetical protein
MVAFETDLVEIPRMKIGLDYTDIIRLALGTWDTHHLTWIQSQGYLFFVE